jgi:xanthine dehydrogenase accessory factor
MLEILDQIVARSNRNEPSVLCTVVRTRGSTPQGAGAAMLVLADGKTIGTLGGGCVEAEVRRRALELIGQRQCRLLTFRLDHDYGWDDGLVCGGIMDVAVQVIDAPAAAASLILVRDRLGANQPVVLAIDAVDEKGQPAHFDLEIARIPSLIIAGGGHVGQALAALASRISFFVTVIDDRPDVLTTERFPGVKSVLGEIERELSSIRIDEQTYVVIVTRGHRHDASALAAVINSPARYIGLIGSKRKVRTILDDLSRQGVPREKLLAVRSPIGLEIGAITPAEIAVSIAAELIAVHHGAGDQPAHPMKMPSEELNRWLDREHLAREAENQPNHEAYEGHEGHEDA